VWAFSTMWVFFTVQQKTTGLRSSEADELAGLDATEMGTIAYPDFGASGPMGAGSVAEAPVMSEA